MVRPIMKDQLFLSMKSSPADEQDLEIARDLLDTLSANAEGCVGMAANMIGVAKRIIAFDNEGTYMVMFNPEIVKTSGPYTTEEGCLSLPGRRTAKRYQSIKVQYQTETFQTRLKTFTGWTAQIIQHEIDHCICIADAPFLSITGSGVNDLAHIPGTGCLTGGGFPLLFIVITQFCGVAAAIQALHIHAPAIFLLHQTGTTANRAVLQLNRMKIKHDENSFGSFRYRKYNTKHGKVQT